MNIIRTMRNEFYYKYGKTIRKVSEIDKITYVSHFSRLSQISGVFFFIEKRISPLIPIYTT